jgi:hypothetical protein
MANEIRVPGYPVDGDPSGDGSDIDFSRGLARKAGSQHDASELKRLAALVQQLLSVVMLQGKYIGELQRKTGFGPEPMTPEENLAITNLARLTQGLKPLDRIEQHHTVYGAKQLGND